MNLSELDYELPDELIAQEPLRERSASRLLHVTSDSLYDRQFRDLPELLAPGDLLILNRSRVIPARLFGQKLSGGRVELLIERILEQHQVLAHLRASRSPSADSELVIEGGLRLRVLGRSGALFRLQFPPDLPVLRALEAHGHMPLPPYIRRDDRQDDRERYQSVFAEQPGAVAAPTAGLHFDHALLEQLRARGVEQAFVTLHVGAGTFLPIRSDDPGEHEMHSEWFEVPPETVEAIRQTHARGGRVVAVGTTVVRSLESAAQADSLALTTTGEITDGERDQPEGGAALRPCQGETRLFILPGFPFKVVDRLITNFHLPRSTLLLLVSAFSGQRRIVTAYRHAVAERYRFFSYGDAMLLERERA